MQILQKTSAEVQYALSYGVPVQGMNKIWFSSRQFLPMIIFYLGKKNKQYNWKERIKICKITKFGNEML